MDLKIDRMEERERAAAAVAEIRALVAERDAALAPFDDEIEQHYAAIDALRKRKETAAEVFVDRIDATHDRLEVQGIGLASDDDGDVIVCAVTGLVVLDGDDILDGGDEFVLRAAILPPRAAQAKTTVADIVSTCDRALFRMSLEPCDPPIGAPSGDQGASAPRPESAGATTAVSHGAGNILAGSLSGND